MKLALKILLVLVLLLVLAIVALFFWLDPNIFKSRIEAMAREQGVHLSINGDLGWTFWPSIGIDINDVSVAALATPEDTIAELRRASLLVATRPLFNRELVVEHLLIDGATANLTVDQTGLGNWQALLPTADIPGDLTAEQRMAIEQEREARVQTERDAPAEADAERELSLAVDKISLTNLTLNYRDLAQDMTLVAELKELDLLGVNFDGKPISIKAAWSASLRDAEQYRDVPLRVNGSLNTQLTMSEDLTEFSLPQVALTLALGTQDLTRLKATVSADVRLLEAGPAYNGKIKLEPFNLKQLLTGLGLPAPETSLETALTRLSFSSDYVGTANSITLSSLQLMLDETSFNGELAITDISRQALVVTLMGDAINVDHYLPPTVEEDASAPAAPAGAGVAAEEPLIPLELVQGLNARVRLDLGQLVMTDLTFTNLRLRVNAAGGVIEMTEASADAYQGKLTARARLDGRGDTALIDFNADVKGFQIAPVMRDLELDDNVQIKGAIELTAVGKTRGVYWQPLMQALELDAQFSGVDVTMAPINVEKYFCQAVTLMRDEQVQEGEQSSEQKQWPDYTVMEPVAGSVRMRNQVITMQGVEASVEELVLGIAGAIDLGEDSYDIRLPLRLVEKTTSDSGCTVRSNYWLDRSLQLLRCRGTLSGLSPLGDCRLDTRIIEDLIKEQAGDRVQRELLRQLEREEKRREEGREEGREGGSSTDRAIEGLRNQLLRPRSQSSEEKKADQ